VTGIPFDDWLRLCVMQFSVSPREFWRLSLREWLILTQSKRAALSRSNLDALLAHWPDRKHEI
jgi:uncharacterized phage protein (TIGR02216 family)